ncbi:MAG: hypothetical protein NC112_06565 [Oxalobacter formigenes]|nr:hypothetical protein [Oxalobacter formigenes]
MQKYQCPNSACPESRKPPLEIAPGKEKTCPGCRTPLKKIPENNRITLIAIAALAVLIIIGGTAFTAFSGSAKTAEAEKAVNARVINGRVMELVNVSSELMQKGENRLAEKKLREAMKLAPDNAVIYYNLAILDIRNEDINASLKNLETAFMKNPALLKQIRQDPDFTELYNNRGFMALEHRFRQSR